jgi:hypothetical protein
MSTAVSRFVSSSAYSDGPSTSGAYSANTSSSSARDANVVSTPYATSPIGLPLVRTSWLVSAPASPTLRTSIVMPVSSVNFFSTSSLIANESWVTSTTFRSPASSPPLLSEHPAIVAVSALTSKNVRKRMTPPPCAGMTRIRFERSRAARPPLSPALHRTPV